MSSLSTFSLLHPIASYNLLTMTCENFLHTFLRADALEMTKGCRSGIIPHTDHFTSNYLFRKYVSVLDLQSLLTNSLNGIKDGKNVPFLGNGSKIFHLLCRDSS